MNSSFSPISSLTQRSISGIVALASFTNAKGTISEMYKCMISAAGKVKRPLSPSFSHEKHKNHTFYKCPFPCYTDK